MNLFNIELTIVGNRRLCGISTSQFQILPLLDVQVHCPHGPPQGVHELCGCLLLGLELVGVACIKWHQRGLQWQGMEELFHLRLTVPMDHCKAWLLFRWLDCTQYLQFHHRLLGPHHRSTAVLVMQAGKLPGKQSLATENRSQFGFQKVRVSYPEFWVDKPFSFTCYSLWHIVWSNWNHHLDFFNPLVKFLYALSHNLR